VDAKIQDLKHIRTALSSLADACTRGEGPTSECPILDAMEEETALEEMGL
jgi:hypothetical protein